jgi:hypothetical protein
MLAHPLTNHRDDDDPATRRRPLNQRRGVVLILILAMLSLLAVIGVTFATFSGQTQVSQRYFAEAAKEPEPERLIDFGIEQLINDTDNPASALRGHSLKRDMYGNDATTNGTLQVMPPQLPPPFGNLSGRAPTITALAAAPGGTLLVNTNIPYRPQGVPGLATADFTRWSLRLDPQATGAIPPVLAAQSFEVLSDANVGGFHQLLISAPDTLSSLAQPIVGATFVLDGRYLRAFNGTGINSTPALGYGAYANALWSRPILANQYPVLAFNGSPLDLTEFSMDEDYDAVDLDNWFLALQSADGQVIVPSFHRPAVLQQNDWIDTTFPARAKFLRPRAIDHPAAGQATFPDLVPDAATGRITYDVDNDGDGVTDSVWLDLGFPALKDASGKLYKPLFAFMIQGLNGRLPLNTAGNLQGRDFNGAPSTDHTSHLGTSPSEVNPKYAFSRQATAPGQLQLQRLLQGFVQNNQPVDGRWGEAELLIRANQNYTATPPLPSLWPRPGRSTVLAGADDLYTAVDFVPEDNPAAAIPTFPEQFDFIDNAAGELLPSERFQRFVTPFDRVGTGRLMAWDDHNPALNLFDPVLRLPRFAHGFDNRGRVGYYQYFRPPGIPSGTLPSFLSPVTQNVQNLYHGFESYRNPLGRLQGGSAPIDTPRLREFWGAMPWNRNFGRVVPTYTTDNTTLGTSSIVATVPGPGAYGLYPGPVAVGGVDPDAGVLGRDIADQMYLYGPTPYDSPFTASDLEWLYRVQDVDGTSLTSRLAGLLPEMFVPNSVGAGVPTVDQALTARRLFSIESWDLNTFAWANDNPGGGMVATPPSGPVAPDPAAPFYHNSVFSGGLNPIPGAAFATTGATSPAQRPGNPSYPSLSDITQLNPAMATRLLAPEPVAHRGRRINLNFPLPASKDPREITRLKWISETYATLKVVLPPKAVDTPLELAQLGQYVVNIIDFRDPDDTVTIWQNPDVRLTAPTTGAVAPATDQPYPVPSTDPLGVNPLVHYGMEHPPVAINEVLAYNFRRQVGTAAVQEPRFYMELVNLLTRDKGLNTSDQTPPTVPSVEGTASNLRLAGWDIVITREETGKTAAARPSPITGQLPFPFRAPTGTVPEPPGTNTYDPLTTTPPLGVYTKVVPLYKRGAGTPAIPEGAMVAPDDTTVVDINGLDDNGNPNFFTIGYPTPTHPSGLPIEQRLGGSGPATGMPNPRAVLRSPILPASPGTIPTTVGTAADILDPAPIANQYYWVYLRRPARSTWNDAVPAERPGGSLNPMVVIDSMRFPYLMADSTVNTSLTPPVATEPTQRMWSTQRLQPLRGGQAVPDNTTTATFFPDWAYGFSEQMERGDDTGTIFGLFDPARGPNTQPAPGSTPNNNTTRNISHSLGTTNEPVDETWRPLVFNDRDFQSVAELMLVPGVPPALFTKHFTESLAVTASAPLDVPPITTYPPNAPTLPTPPTFPYLVDNFFYSGNGVVTTDNATTNPVVPGTTGPVVGGPTGAGWHKMLEFFEVPAPNLGAIGPVASGENRDWARQDLRPGQINLNLIIDEEVFFGLFDDPRLNFKSGLLVDPTVDPNLSPPVVVTQVNASGLPDKWYPISNRGFYLDPASGLQATAANGGIKAAFADFLRLRHGNPAVGPSHFLSFGGIAAEMPYHSLSYPDIRYTLMRPADPANTGLKAPPGPPPIQPPPIPPRRLFQVPDYNFLSSGGLPNPATFDWQTGVPPYPLTRLSDAFVNLFDRSILNAMTGPPGPAPGPGPRFFLGGDPDVNPGPPPVITQPDRREHPLYRTEMLQKLMNLSTVRTHQYAVWVTVGLFEVTKPGNPQLAATNPSLAVDQLGPEVGKAQGNNKRYRSFFVIDRARATGFNPREPGDFRELVIYRRRIE